MMNATMETKTYKLVNHATFKQHSHDSIRLPRMSYLNTKLLKNVLSNIR
jgi:hypothetical protein